MSTLTEQLDRFQEWLRHLPGCPRFRAIRIVESGQIQYGRVDTIPSGALATIEAYESRFETLFAAGYSWINLSAAGVADGILLVIVELPRAPAGVPRGRTSVNFSGPPLDVTTGAPVWDAAKRIRFTC